MSAAQSMSMLAADAPRYGSNPVDAYYQLNGAGGGATDLVVDGNLTVEGTSDLQGAVTCGDSLSVAQNLTVTGNSSVGGNETLSGNLFVGGDLTVTGLIQSDVEINGNLVVDGSVSLNTSLVIADPTGAPGVAQAQVTYKNITNQGTVFNPNGLVSLSMSDNTNIVPIVGDPAPMLYLPGGMRLTAATNMLNAQAAVTTPDYQAPLQNVDFDMIGNKLRLQVTWTISNFDPLNPGEFQTYLATVTVKNPIIQDATFIALTPWMGALHGGDSNGNADNDSTLVNQGFSVKFQNGPVGPQTMVCTSNNPRGIAKWEPNLGQNKVVITLSYFDQNPAIANYRPLNPSGTSPFVIPFALTIF
jgi:cytoskeletal protein CcmA (bactofilin family)